MRDLGRNVPLQRLMATVWRAVIECRDRDSDHCRSSSAFDRDLEMRTG
jgi:hypothetical protein